MEKKSLKNTISMSEDYKECIDILLNENKLFKDELSIGKFAIFYAIKEKIPDNLNFNNKKTKWNIGTFDNNRSITKIIKDFYPDYEYKSVEKIEYLVNAGLSKINDEVKKDKNWINKEIEALTDTIIKSG